MQLLLMKMMMNEELLWFMTVLATDLISYVPSFDHFIYAFVVNPLLLTTLLILWTLNSISS